MKTKKLAAFVLSIAMIVGSVPAFVFAEDVDEVDNACEVTEETTADEEEAEEDEDSEEDLTEDIEIPTYGDPEESTIVEQGECGEHAAYTLTDSGKLTITGTGMIIEIDSWKNVVKSAVICEGITEIDRNTFKDCKSLVDISLPSTLTSIGVSAFSGCQALRTVSIPDSVEYIHDGAFMMCSNLEEVTLSNSIENIYSYTFYGCKELKSIAIPEGVTMIGRFAFNGCSSLERVTIPSTVTSIESCAFDGCSAVTDVYIYIADADALSWQGYSSSFGNNTAIHVLNMSFYHKFTDIIDKFYNDLGDFNGMFAIKGYSLSLKGNIGVNVYIECNQEVLDRGDISLKIDHILANGDDDRHYFVPITEATIDTTTIPGRTLYVYQFDVAPKEMNDDIWISIIDSRMNELTSAYEFTVKQYGEYIINHTEKYDDKTRELVASMLAYGCRAQNYFGYGLIDGQVDFDYTSIANDYIDCNPIPFYYYELPDGVDFVSANLELESELVMNLFFTGVEDGTVFELCNDNVDVTISQRQASNGYTIVTISDIGPTEMFETFDIRIKAGGNNVGEVEYSPVKYCYNVLTRDTTATRTDNLKDVIRALIAYGFQAKELYESGRL